jgi:hypothetical protein
MAPQFICETLRTENQSLTNAEDFHVECYSHSSQNFANTLKNYSLTFVGLTVIVCHTQWGFCAQDNSKLPHGMQLKSDINDLQYFELSASACPSPV